MLIEPIYCESWNEPPAFLSVKAWSLCVTEFRDHILGLCDSNEVNSLGNSGSDLWEVVRKRLRHQETNAQFWWSTTGPLLATLLREASYHISAQFEILLFYFLFIVPELGPRPDSFGRFAQWESFMTDENMPIELSWDWGLGGTSPTVRLSMEPSGLDAGTPEDPLNEHATHRIVDKFWRTFPSTDLSLYHHFSKELLTYNIENEINDAALTTAGHRSRSFVAFDFGQTGIMLKAYFFPVFKAREAGQSSIALISQAIAKLAKVEGLRFPGYDCLSDYIRTSPIGSGFQAEMLSIDCVSPVSSRMKLYLRSQSTSFDSVRANMTLDGKLKQQDLEKGILELEKLWKLVLFPVQTGHPNEELPHKAHRTAGLLYYYDIGPGRSYPTPRLYIPVRHYGRNDSVIVEGLVSYLKTRGQDGMGAQYLKVLRNA